jgi:tetratricopeptide (TPR) repeat protein
MLRMLFVLLLSFSFNQSAIGQKSASELLKQAVICSEAGSLEAAIELCNQAIFLSPKYELAFFQRAIAHELIGNFNRAIEDYSTTIQLNSNNIQAHLNRGILYKKQKKTWAAFRDFNAARSIDAVYTISFLSGQAIKSLF